MLVAVAAADCVDVDVRLVGTRVRLSAKLPMHCVFCP